MIRSWSRHLFTDSSPDQNPMTRGTQTAVPYQERSWVPGYISGKLVSISGLISESHRDRGFSASVCKPLFPSRSWKRACVLLAVCFPRPWDAGQRNTTRMQEQIRHNKVCIMFGPRTGCSDTAAVCGHRWAWLLELKCFKRLKPGINSEHMELLHLGSDSTNACG